MKINVVTIFPEVMETVLSMGMLSVAGKKGLVRYRCVSPREFTSDVHRTVDDEPYGGGAGMIMMAPPVVDAVESLGREPGSPVVLLSPDGSRFDQEMARRFAGEAELTFVCGRYKGVDERIRELVVTDVVSTGDYILSGGELAAAVCIEATVRLLQDVLGNEDSRDTDSFEEGRGGMLDCSWYTRPVEYRGLSVPEVLLSGHHKEIEKWRTQSSIERTRKYRPDLLNNEDEL
ncbi:MAG: tRNA (guanosine(37)-N1)-methyltransferase TrmD [Candidatus Latescibacterota bacterium]